MTRTTATTTTTTTTRPGTTARTTTRPTRPMLRGAFTALVTPFTADGELDEAAFRRRLAAQTPSK